MPVGRVVRTSPTQLTVIVAVTLLALTTRAYAATINVPAGGNLQAAINAAQPGDTIHLQAGATYIGNFTLPMTNAPLVITIRTAPDSRLPGPGRRIRPADAFLLAKVRSGNSGAAFQTAPGAHHWRLELLEIGATTGGYGEIIRLGRGGIEQNTLALVPHHLVIDRCYVHGDPLTGQKRGIALNSASTTIIGSYISDIKGSGMDTQAIGGWNGPGPYLIENNYLEAAGENVMFGGADPQIPNLVPSDITLRLNHFIKPRSWQQPIIPKPVAAAAPLSGAGSLPAGTYAYRVVARRSLGQGLMGTSEASAEVVATLTAAGAVRITWTPVPDATEYRVYGRTAGAQNRYWTLSGTSFTDTGAAGTAGSVPTTPSTWTAKNLLELKNARRVLAEGNVLEHNWRSGQGGLALVISPRNQDGTAPWSVVSDVTFRYNIVRHVGGGLSINGYDTEQSSQQGRNVRVESNLFTDISAADGTSGRFLIMGNGPANVTIEHNTILQSGSILYVYERNTNGTYDVVQGFRFANNIALHNVSGIVGEEAGGFGLPSILTYFLSGTTVVRNVMAGGSASKYPADNLFPSVAALMGEFADASYRLRSTSPYKFAGTDGADLGADIERLTELTTLALSGGDSTVPTNFAPTAHAGGPYQALTLATVVAQGGASSDSDGTIVSYVWNWGDGSPNGAGVSASHQYANSGIYTVTLVVTDNTGATDSASTTVTISNRPPTAKAGGPYSTQPGVAFTANGSGSSDLDGSIASYRWKWGDGTPDTVGPNATASHTYGSAGNYSIVLTVTDDEGAVATSTASVTVQAAATSDLVVSALSAPASAAVGGSMPVSDTTSNIAGTAAASSTWFYLSTNPSLDASDAVLGSRAVPALANGAASSSSVSLAVPSTTAAGLYYVIAKADGNQAIAEASESNNVRTSAAVRVGPDLRAVTVTGPTRAAAGGSVVVGDTTRNEGAGAAAASSTTYYLSTNVTLDAADVAIGGRSVPGLIAAASNTGSASVVIPAGTTPGSYFLFAKADGGNAVGESIETNNGSNGVILRVGPDLDVSSLTAPSQATAGAAISVTDTTRNSGGSSAAASTTRFYLSTNTTVDAADRLLGSRSVGVLTVDQTNSIATALTIPSGTAPASYFIIAVADGANAIAESVETNNTRTRPVQVIAP
jgi:PKD repeat protein